MRQGERNPSVPEDVDVKLKRAAHHEAGHMVIAAAQGLRLQSEGLMVDLHGDGRACYCKQPDGSDLSRELRYYRYVRRVLCREALLQGSLLPYPRPSRTFTKNFFRGSSCKTRPLATN